MDESYDGKIGDNVMIGFLTGEISKMSLLFWWRRMDKMAE